ncbi:ABC transporter G family member 21 [Abeliophyllum distichum]|uniref:ABC transporter G family member 21 n=1 Tax=Abeliophyllum distichum TaxID=126358 RepID=A0ABD1SYQ6_9LAMI
MLYPHLTVLETLTYAALLRLPNKLTRQEKTEHAEFIIIELGLTTCRNSMVGGSLFRGISGGERKRVSIGQEMLVNPSLLLLDEPTSGLDSTTAQRIVTTLRRLACGGRTVITTIHQPSSSLYMMFDKVIVLSEGCPIYSGIANNAMDYFASIGYKPGFNFMNPADFLLDLANGVTPETRQDDQMEFHGKHDEHNSTKQFLISSYKKNLLPILKEEMQRASLDEIRPGKSLPSRSGIALFLLNILGFFPLFHAVFTFPQERPMLTKELSSGMYRLSSYYLARIAGDLPMELILPTIFTTITYWMSGLKPSLITFLLTLCIILLNVLVSQGLGLALGAVVMDLKQATTLSSVMILVFLLASGYYIQHMPPFINWLKYVSFCHYCYKFLVVVQYSKNEIYECGLGGKECNVKDFPAIKYLGIDNMVLDMAVLIVMLVGYRVLAYVALRLGQPH